MGDNTATVTIQRTVAGKGVIDLTVSFRRHDSNWGDNWHQELAQDEDGNAVELTHLEADLARCMVEAGVDDSGR